MLINVTIQTFVFENELELSDKRWTDVKDEYQPTHNTPAHSLTRLFGSGHLLRTQRLILQDLQSP